MSQPFSGLNVFITIGGISYVAQDLNIIKMEVTDSDEGDNEIDLTCIDNDFHLIDSPDFRVGKTISVKWGYTNGPNSQERKNYILHKTGVHYSSHGVEATFKAYTKSATLSIRKPQKVYGATSVRQIVSEIANRNGLALTIKGGDEKLHAFAMSNWSDRQVLRILADRYGYQVSFSSEAVVFAPVDYGAAPGIQLVYGLGETGNILTASLNVDARKSKGATSATAAAINPVDKTFNKAIAADATKTLAISAEDGHTWISTNIAAVTSALHIGAGSPLVPPVHEVDPNAPPGIFTDIMNFFSTPDVHNLSAHATGEKLKKEKKKGELSITSIGMVNGTSRKIINVKGLAKRDSGNWYAQSVRHEITHGSGYVCHWELTRHGNNTKGGVKNKAPLNTSTPTTTTANTTIPVVAVDAESGKLTQ